MADEKKLAQAKAAFETLCLTLDNRDWHYDKVDDMSIKCGARGEDLPIDLHIRVDAERMLVMVLSFLPCTMPEDKRLDAAIAISAINYSIVDGSFDYDVGSGRIVFRMTNSILDTHLSDEVYFYMVLCACQTVDAYNDKLLMLAKGMVSIEQFLSSLNS